VLFGVGILFLVAGSSDAWFTEGHRRVAEAAVESLPQRVPDFFRAEATAVGHSAIDPDLEKSRSLPELRSQESPEHYLDRERVAGPELPRSRYAFLDTVSDSGFSVVEVGTLPYAILEETQRLALAFAEYRRWPENPYVQRKALIYAGNLAHYSADLCQPLHTTVHHDGRAKPDGSSPFSGIHRLVDGLFEADIEGARIGTLPAIEDLHRAIVTAFDESHALVDYVYSLEEALRRASGDTGSVSPEVTEFALQRYEVSVRFTASLFLYAWDRSGEIELPGWHDRSEETKPVDEGG